MDDQRDYAEEQYNRAEMEREAQEEYRAEQAEERKAQMHFLYRQIITNTIEAAKLWEKSVEATKNGQDTQARNYAEKWAKLVELTKAAESRFKGLADF